MPEEKPRGGSAECVARDVAFFYGAECWVAAKEDGDGRRWQEAGGGKRATDGGAGKRATQLHSCVISQL